MSKPTEEQISQAVECNINCPECYYYESKTCMTDAAKDAAELILAQAARIRELEAVLEKPRWHDLGENPDDLPEPNNPVLCCYRYIGYNTPRWYERYGVGYIVLEVDIGKVSHAWRGDVTGGKCPQVLRWQRILI